MAHFLLLVNHFFVSKHDWAVKIDLIWKLALGLIWLVRDQTQLASLIKWNELFWDSGFKFEFIDWWMSLGQCAHCFEHILNYRWVGWVGKEYLLNDLIDREQPCKFIIFEVSESGWSESGRKRCRVIIIEFRWVVYNSSENFLIDRRRVSHHYEVVFLESY